MFVDINLVCVYFPEPGAWKDTHIMRAKKQQVSIACFLRLLSDPCGQLGFARQERLFLLE